MDTNRIPRSGDPFTAKAPKVGDRDRLAELEAAYRHQLYTDDEERQELRDRVLRLRRRIGL